MSDTVKERRVVGGIGLDSDNWSSGVVHLAKESDQTYAECGVTLGAGCRYWEVDDEEVQRAVTCQRCRTSLSFRAAVVDPVRETPTNFHESFDARDWAAAFVATLKENPSIVEEDCMLGWFANALMRGYDEANKRSAAALSAAQRDSDRLDWLEGERERERAVNDRLNSEPNSGAKWPRSLFRQNVPITRQAIDAAISGGSTPRTTEP